MRLPENPPAKGTQVYFEAAPGLQVLCVVTNAKVIGRKRLVQIVPLHGKGIAYVPPEKLRSSSKGGR